MSEHHAPATEMPNEGNVLTPDRKQAVRVADFRVVGTGAAPKQATHAAVIWDDESLDVVFDCVDSDIVAEQKGHDNVKLWKDDCVYVWLDPGHTHNAGENLIMVQVSAGGEWCDQRNGDRAFDIEGLSVEVSRTAKGWRAHLRMPWKGLGASCPQTGDVWGLNLARMDQPGRFDSENMECSSLVTIPDGDLAKPDRWGHIVFTDAKGGPPAGGAVLRAARKTMAQMHAARRDSIRMANGGNGSGTAPAL